MSPRQFFLHYNVGTLPSSPIKLLTSSKLMSISIRWTRAQMPSKWSGSAPMSDNFRQNNSPHSLYYTSFNTLQHHLHLLDLSNCDPHCQVISEPELRIPHHRIHIDLHPIHDSADAHKVLHNHHGSHIHHTHNPPLPCWVYPHRL